MEIVKNNVFIEVTCPHCQSELRVFEKDISVYHAIHHGTRIEVRCAACKKTIDLNKKQLRPEWEHLLDNPDED